VSIQPAWARLIKKCAILLAASVLGQCCALAGAALIACDK
jgi:hypothetical protein